jgi:hypothetical protein
MRWTQLSYLAFGKNYYISRFRPWGYTSPGILPGRLTKYPVDILPRPTELPGL